MATGVVEDMVEVEAEEDMVVVEEVDMVVVEEVDTGHQSHRIAHMSAEALVTEEEVDMEVMEVEAIVEVEVEEEATEELEEGPATGRGTPPAGPGGRGLRSRRPGHPSCKGFSCHVFIIEYSIVFIYKYLPLNIYLTSRHH